MKKQTMRVQRYDIVAEFSWHGDVPEGQVRVEIGGVKFADLSGDVGDAVQSFLTSVATGEIDVWMGEVDPDGFAVVMYGGAWTTVPCKKHEHLTYSNQSGWFPLLPDAVAHARQLQG